MVEYCQGLTTKKVRCKIKVPLKGKYCNFHTYQDPNKKSKFTNVDASVKNETVVSEEAYCKGITKENKKCKVKIKVRGGYCRYHISQDPSKSYIDNHNQKIENHSVKSKVAKVKLKVESIVDERLGVSAIDKNAGSIYIYTYPHLVTRKPTIVDWLKIEQNEVEKIFDPKLHILLKIGLTTQTVAERIKQWEDQCNHKITIVDKKVLKNTLPSYFSSIFNKSSKSQHYDPQFAFSTSKKFINNIGSRFKLRDDKSITYNNQEKGFECSHNLRLIESYIHEVLRKRYGRISLICNCGPSNSKKIHREWFLIPREEAVRVFYFVDEVCYNLSKNKDYYE